MSHASRNDPCPCGSQKKYKNCCLPADESDAAGRHADRQNRLKTVPTLIEEGIRLHQAGQLGEARQRYQEILNINPDDPDALHLLGVIARDNGLPEEAIILIRRAITVLPGEASFHNNLGMTYRRLDQLDEALSCYEKAIALCPDHTEALNNQGNIFSVLGVFPKAIRCFQRAIASKPSFAEAHFNLGHIFQTLERNEEALACYRRALSIRPGYVEALSNCGMTLHTLRRDDEALACLEQAITLQPDFQAAYMNIGCMSLNNGLAREALPFLRHANTLNPEQPDTLNYLSHAEKDLGLIEDAANHAQQAFLLAPDSKAGLEAATRLALIKYLQGDHAGAGHLLSQSTAISHEGDRSVRAYRTYLERLIAWWKIHDGLAEKPDRVLYVIGDSHTLSLHGLTIDYEGQSHQGQALWVEGCKQWHLGNTEENTYKSQFETFLARIPEGMPVLVSVGEIDCRPDEGILKAWHKQPTESLATLITTTIDNYISYLTRMRDIFRLKIALSGIPATNAPLNMKDKAATQHFLTLLQDFNHELARQAEQAGMGFLDLYALTNVGDAKADGRWHIDDIHLQPAAYAQAFSTY